jgi:hypothetical protein
MKNKSFCFAEELLPLDRTNKAAISAVVAIVPQNEVRDRDTRLTEVRSVERPNKAFWRALHRLTHDTCLGALLILLLNDHLLRIAFPSWITGKLGDFAWLVFAPFICASVLALFIRSRSQERVVGARAFIFIVGIKAMPLLASTLVKSPIQQQR